MKMNRSFINLIILSFLILISSCAKNNQKSQSIEDESLYTISAENNSSKTTKYDSFINNLKFLKLETNTDCLIGEEIKNVKIEKDRIFILDNNTNLFVFDLNGNFLHKIGRRGDGPGEVQSISNFCLNKELEEIILFDIAKNTLLLFDYDGKFIRSTKFNERLDITNFEVINNKELLVEFLNTKYNDVPDSNRRYNYGIVNIEDNSIKSRFIPFLVKLNMPVLMNGLMETSDKQALMTTLFSNTLYKYDRKSDKMQKYLEITPKDDLKFISSSTFEQDQSQDYLEVMQYIYKNNYTHGINKILLTSKYIFLNVWTEQGKTTHIVFDMETHQSFEFNFDKKLIAELDEYILNIPPFKNNNTVIKVLQSEYLIANKTKYEPIKGLYDSINELNGEENPILIFYDLNHLLESSES